MEKELTDRLNVLLKDTEELVSLIHDESILIACKTIEKGNYYEGLIVNIISC